MNRFCQIVKILIIIRGEVYSVADLRIIKTKYDLKEICQVPLEALILDKNRRIPLKKNCV